MKQIIAYTDGSAVVKGKCKCERDDCPKCNRLGGVGAYILYDGKEIFLSKGYKNTTISRMEMRALLYTIKKIPKKLKCKLTVYSDSQFICKAFSEGWLENWKLDGFLGRSNSDIWKEIVSEIELRPNMVFDIIHTRGHLTDLNNHIVYGNNIADCMANYKIHKKYEYDRH